MSLGLTRKLPGPALTSKSTASFLLKFLWNHGNTAFGSMDSSRSHSRSYKWGSYNVDGQYFSGTFHLENEALLASAVGSHPQPAIAKVIVHKEDVPFLNMRLNNMLLSIMMVGLG